MVRKKRKLSLSPKRLLILLIIVGFIFAALYVGLTFWNRGGEDYGKEDKTLTVFGQVTKKRTSCGLDVLLPDGKVKKGGGICDAGNSLTVNDISISTGGGGLTGGGRFYISDIDNINAGDYVEVRYVQESSENGRVYGSTNCETCYVRKQGNPRPEEQTLIDRGATQRTTRANTIPQTPKLINSYIPKASDSARKDGASPITSPLVLAWVPFALFSLFLFFWLHRKQGKKTAKNVYVVPLTRKRKVKIDTSSIRFRVVALALIAGVFLLITALSAQLKEGQLLHGILTCTKFPVEIYSDDGKTYYRIFGDPGYGVSLNSDYSQCDDENMKQNSYYQRDPNTEAGKLEKVKDDAREQDVQQKQQQQQQKLLEEIEYTIFVPEGYSTSDIRMTDYRGMTGYDAYGIRAYIKLSNVPFTIHETKVTPENDSLCATYGERYSDCRVVAKDNQGRAIEQNFKPLLGPTNLGVLIGNTKIELYGHGTVEQAILLINAMKPFEE